MLINTQQFPHQRFDRITIADLTNFQIAIPTTKKQVKKRILSAWVYVPKRIYDSQGWLICDRQIVADIKGLKVGAVFQGKSTFEQFQLIGPTIPISFKIEASNSLPSQVSSLAAFACQFSDKTVPYHAVFQNVVPRFASIYLFEKNSSILDKVDQMLEAEKLFIAQNYERLKRIPFYQKHFGL